MHIAKYKIFIRFLGINFCIKSLNRKLSIFEINPTYLIRTLNSNYISFLKPSCLVKALTFKKLAKGSDYTVLCIGVAKIDGLFESHAWVEKHGYVILNSVPNINIFKKIFTYE